MPGNQRDRHRKRAVDAAKPDNEALASLVTRIGSYPDYLLRS